VPAAPDVEQVLAVLDQGARDFVFPMLDNGYIYPAASRLSLFRSKTDWAMVFETFGFSPRAGIPNLCVTTFASRIANPRQAADFVLEDAYRNYLRHHRHDETAFFEPIEDDEWIDLDDGEHVAGDARQLLLRGERIPLPGQADYSAAGVSVEDASRPLVFELCRSLAHSRRNAVLATDSERRTNVPAELEQLLILDDWHHPDVVESDCLPSGTATFRQLAAVVLTGDLSLYRPVEPANTHWSNWPGGGLL
jgi:hypothetical protein